MTIFCDEGIKIRQSLILYKQFVVIIINNFYRGETMEKKKLILLLPLSRFLFTLSRQSDASLFLFFLFVVDVCIRLIIASSFSKAFFSRKRIRC